jgi:hypothetical protein
MPTERFMVVQTEVVDKVAGDCRHVVNLSARTSEL